MLEFVFFDPRPRDKFLAFLHESAVESTLCDDDDVLNVAIDEEIDDRLLTRIEAYYDEMMALNQRLLEQEEPAQNAAGVVVNLASGDTVYAQLAPDLLARVMTVLTPEELGTLVDAVVEAVENPDNRTLCQRKGS
jgi:hypothetical protein